LPAPSLSLYPDNDQRAVTSTSSKHQDLQSLDTLTGGAFTAPTSGERAQRIREWLAKNPSPEQMQEVFKELSGRDKGAARLLREKLGKKRSPRSGPRRRRRCSPSPS
jgi:ATP-dependent RNA helicase SUPV3L1/SUV3